MQIRKPNTGERPHTGRNQQSGLPMVGQLAAVEDSRDMQITQLRLHQAAHSIFAMTNLAQIQAKMAAKTETLQGFEVEQPIQEKRETPNPLGEVTTVAHKFDAGPTSFDVDNSLKNTGLPAQLMKGIEALTGMSMAHVKVNYNSDKPAQLNAHAYAQGSEIHVAPGQEKHLPHEAWHLVQQAQGRVAPTMQMKTGVQVNDDVGLEREADLMGERALGMGQRMHSVQRQTKTYSSWQSPVQLKSQIDYGGLTDMKAGKHNIQVATKVEAHLDPYRPILGSDTSGFSGWGDKFIGDMKQLTGESWVAGHLINHDLGGRGVIHNFFPITKKANSQHLFEVEYPVKAWITDGHTVDYSVTAWQKDTSSGNPAAYFDCFAEVSKAHPFKSKPGKIHKQIQSKSEKLDGQNASYAHFKDNEYTDRSRRGVPKTWAHLSGSKYDRELEERFGDGAWRQWNEDDLKFTFDRTELGEVEDLDDLE